MGQSAADVDVVQRGAFEALDRRAGVSAQVPEFALGQTGGLTHKADDGSGVVAGDGSA